MQQNMCKTGKKAQKKYEYKFQKFQYGDEILFAVLFCNLEALYFRFGCGFIAA